jgi:hypothetical protein
MEGVIRKGWESQGQAVGSTVHRSPAPARRPYNRCISIAAMMNGSCPLVAHPIRRPANRRRPRRPADRRDDLLPAAWPRRGAPQTLSKSKQAAAAPTLPSRPAPARARRCCRLLSARGRSSALHGARQCLVSEPGGVVDQPIGGAIVWRPYWQVAIIPSGCKIRLWRQAAACHLYWTTSFISLRIRSVWNFVGTLTLFIHFALDPFLLARLCLPKCTQATEPQSRPNEKTRPAHWRSRTPGRQPAARSGGCMGKLPSCCSLQLRKGMTKTTRPCGVGRGLC